MLLNASMVIMNTGKNEQRHNSQGPAKYITGVVEYLIDGRQYANEVEYLIKQ